MDVKIFNRNSIYLRISMIGLLILVLMIPSAMISSVIGERENRKREAIAEITSKWAKEQTLGGPIITIPYENRWKDTDGKIQTDLKYIQVLPQLLSVRGQINPEIRYRGIYKAVLYNAKVDMEGTFSFTKLESLNLNPENIQWKDAFDAILIPDMRGIKDNVELKWDKESFLFEPGIKEGNFFNSGISVKVPLPPDSLTREGFKFSVKLDLNGSEEFNLLPLGQKTIIRLASGWNNPRF
jgi:inner membrane protein